MKKRKRRKKTLVLVVVLYLLLACALAVSLFLCYLSFDLNQNLKQRRNEIITENQGLAVKAADLEKTLTELQKAEPTPEPTAAPEDNGVLTPSSGDGIFADEAVSLESLTVGQVIDEFQVMGNEDQYFKAYEITEGDAVYSRINGKSYYENENIGLADLRYLKMAHYNFDHQVQIGEMIVNAAIAEDVLSLFQELFFIEYEIQSMRLIDDYWTGDGDSSDSNSIEHNNTSAFCYRQVTGGGSLSNHAFGRAIDINPQQNPYVWYSGGQPQWSHENASPYIDRSIEDPHVIKEGDSCYNLFSGYGFEWGGLWNGIKDYQHFEKE